MSDRSRLLVGDIGGTNARFALASDAAPAFEQMKTLECADFATAENAISRYLDEFGIEPELLCLAVAGPVTDGAVTFTNNDWAISESETSARFGGIPVRLLNDFEAVAYSVALIEPAYLHQVGPVPVDNLDADDYTVAIVGPGTGLGVAGLCRRKGGIWPIMGEGGHLGFAPASSEQADLLRILESRFGRVSNERLLSGPGLENIHAALIALGGHDSDDPSATEIFERTIAGTPGPHVRAVELFFEILGQAAGDAALLLGARQGVYIAGGIVQRYPDLLLKSRFRAAFESKGRHAGIMARIPTSLITYPQPGLLGASYCALQMARGAA